MRVNNNNNNTKKKIKVLSATHFHTYNTIVCYFLKCRKYVRQKSWRKWIFSKKMTKSSAFL